MSTTMTKQQVLDAIDADERRWNRLVEAVGPEDAVVPGAMGDWTFKDLAAHINGWRQSSVSHFDRAMTGAPLTEPWPDSIDSEDDDSVDEVNDWIYQQSRDRPISGILADTAEHYRRLRAIVANAPEAKLFSASRSDDGTSYGEEMISGSFFDHLTDEHWSDVTEWLASLGKEPPELD